LIRRTGILLLAVIVFCFPIGYSNDVPESPHEIHEVLVTTEVLADIAGNVGRGVVSVKSVLGGNSPETFTLTPRTASEIAGAYAFLYIGYGSEDKVGKIAHDIRKGVRTFRLIDLMGMREVREAFWVSPSGATALAEAVARVLSELFPEKARLIERNLEELRVELRDLDAWIRSELKSLRNPLALATIRPSLDALARDYGLEVVAKVADRFGTYEPTAARSMAFFERVREKGAVVLYEEAEEGSTLMELIEANSARLGLVVAGPVYFERFDPERGITSYRELVKWNVRLISSLAGAPERHQEGPPVPLAVLLPGMVALIAVSVATSLVGSFAVMRGWAIFGDALSHGAIAGLVAAYIVGFDFYLGALAAGLFVAFSVSYLERRTGLRGDVVIAVTFTSMLALAVLMLSRSGGAALKLEDVLFADVMASSDEGVLGTVVFSSAVVAFLFAFRKTLLAYVTDPLWSEASGMRTALVHYSLLMLLSVTVITAFMTVGAIPAVASMIIPPAAALLLTSSPRSYLLASALIPAFSSFVGTALSVLFDTNVGSTVVLVYAAIFVATALTLRRL